MAYAAVEPFGEYRSEVRHGQQMALTCNMNRDPRSKPEPYQALDFMNFIDKPKDAAKIVDLGPEENAKLMKAQIMACMEN